MTHLVSYNRRLLQGVALAGLWVGLFSVSDAQGPIPLPEATTPDSLDHYFIDFSVPDLAAFTLLGLEGSQVSRPGNVRELAFALSNAIGEEGAAAQGVGVEVALPRILAQPRTLREYRGLRDRFTLSFATLREQDTTRFGVGFRWVPVDTGDPYEATGLHADLRRYVREALDTGVNAEERARFQNDLVDRLRPAGFPRDAIRGIRARLDPQPDSLRRLPEAFTAADARQRLTPLLNSLGIIATDVQEAALREVTERYALLVRLAKSADVWATLEEHVVALKDSFRAATWNAFSLQFAAGATVRAVTVEDIRVDAISAFSGLTLPLTRRSQLVVHGQVHLPFDDDDPLTAYDDGLRASIGGRLLVGSATQRFSLEALYGTNDPRLEGDSHTRFTVGGEFRVSEGVYLELATGLDDAKSSPAQFLTLGSLKYALRQDRRFASP
ncbi:MAG: hypothetical protein HKN04_07135 [Rhodothermaceae bacterium]|nr:hypothetical protein [Rhodothermaceae bacterium]